MPDQIEGQPSSALLPTRKFPPRALVACSWWPEWGGREQWNVRTLAALQARGHRVTFFCHPGQAEYARAAGLAVAHYPLRGDLTLTDAVRMAYGLRKYRPDALMIVHEPKVWLAGLAGRIARVPRIALRISLSHYRARKLKYRFAYTRCVDAVVCNADTMTQTIRADLAGHAHLPALVTIHNGVAPRPAQREPGALRAELGVPAGAQLAGVVSRLVSRKRIDFAITALTHLPEHVHLAIAGDGEFRERLERHACDIGVADRTHVLGYRDDVWDVLPAFDVFLMTSRYEGMSNAVLEAMAAGVPVVSTLVSGALEMLEPDAHGAAPGTIVAGEPAAIAAAAAHILSSAELRARMGEAGRRRVEERFGMQRMLDEWEAVLFGELPPRG